MQMQTVVLDFSAPPSSAALINLSRCGRYIQLIGLNMVGVQSAELKCTMRFDKR